MIRPGWPTWGLCVALFAAALAPPAQAEDVAETLAQRVDENPLDADAQRYPWGDASPVGRAALDSTHGPEIADDWDRRVSVHAPARGASPEGVRHLVGNVAEWCADGPDDEQRWLVGGAADSNDVQTPVEFRDSLEHSRSLDETEGHLDAYYGARCVADPPR